MIDDAEMLRRYAEEGSEEAFGAFVRAQVDLVYSAALRRLEGDAHGAADVTQQVFVAAAHRAGELARHPCVTAWLYTTTRHAVLDHRRSEQRRRQRELAAPCTGDGADASAAGDASWQQLRPLLDAAMDELSEGDREAVLLRFFEGRGFAAIGARLGLGENAARMRVERALEKLHAQLARRGVASTAAALGLVLGGHACAAAPAGLGASATAAALASAGSAIGPVAGAGAAVFMSTTKFYVGAAAALLALAGTVTWVRHDRAGEEADLRADRALLVARRSEAAALARRADALAAEIAERRREAGAAAAREDARPRATATPGGAPAPPAAPARSPVAEGNAFLTQHPEVRQALNGWADATVNARFGMLLNALALDEAQREAFRALTRSMAFVPDTEPDGKVMQLNAGPRLSRDEVQRQLRDLLGPDGFRAYQDFEDRTRAREFATELASALAFTESPLAPAQARQVMTILHGAGARRDNPRLAGTVDWEGALAQAQPLLTPAQFAALKGVRARDRYTQAWQTLPNPFGPTKGGTGK